MNVTAIIEIPQGSYCKYEQNKEDGSLILDRILNQPVPYNYGFIPNTLCGDGDPLDVFVVCDESVHPLAKVKVQIVGVLRCTDNGDSDDKIIAHLVDEIRPFSFGSTLIINYLESYKKGFVVHELLHQDKAIEIYQAAKEAYEASNRGK